MTTIDHSASGSASRFSKWTQEQRDQIATLLREGLSASQIALHFEGKSRNAIVGIVHRDRALKAIGFKWDGRNRARKPAAKAAPVKAEPPIDHVSFSAPQVAGIPLMMFDGRRCKWCINDPEVGSNAHLFCGEVSAPGSPYCAFHATASISKGTEDERSAIRSALKIAA